MSSNATFEARLLDAFAEYVLPAPTDVDAAAMTDYAARAARRRRFRKVLPVPGSRWLVPAGLALLLLGLVAAAYVGARLLLEAPPAIDPYKGVFEPAGQMTIERLSPLMAELADGRVLIAGGFGDEIPAEIFDPATGTSQRLDGPTPSGENGSVVYLPDGEILMIAYNGNHTTSRAWVFDTTTESFHEIAHPGEATAPPFGVLPGVAALRDGRVLVAGGTDDALVADPKVLSSAVLFDPVSETFAPTGSMSVPRVGHSTTALVDGRVVVAGGWQVRPVRLGLSRYTPGQPNSTVEIYDPQTGTFTPAGSMPTVTGPNMAVRLPDGRVLIMSAPVDQSDGLPPRPPVAMDVYDPATGRFSALPRLSLAIDDAIVLRDGRMLLAGAEVEWTEPDGCCPFDQPWAAIYDPSDGSVEPVPPRLAKNPGITTLSDGTVLFAGGFSYASPGGDTPMLTSVEIFR